MLSIQRKDNIIIIRINELPEFLYVNPLFKKIEKIIYSENNKKVIIDLSNISSLDYTILSSLIHLQQVVTISGIELVYTNIPPNIISIINKFHNGQKFSLSIIPTLDESIAYFKD